MTTDTTRCWDCDALGFTCATHKRAPLPPRLRFCRRPACAVKVYPPSTVCDDHLVDHLIVCGCGYELAGKGEPMVYQAPPEHGCPR